MASLQGCFLQINNLRNHINFIHSYVCMFSDVLLTEFHCGKTNMTLFLLQISIVQICEAWFWFVHSNLPNSVYYTRASVVQIINATNLFIHTLLTPSEKDTRPRRRLTIKWKEKIFPKFITFFTSFTKYANTALIYQRRMTLVN